MIRFVAVLAVVMAGCGSVDGLPCEKADSSQCDGPRVAYCERASSGGLKWRSYDCPSGCDVLKPVLKCDWRGVVAGASCPAGFAALEFCSGDGSSMLCARGVDGGAWVEIPCSRCQAGARVTEVLDCSGGNGACSCG